MTSPRDVDRELVIEANRHGRHYWRDLWMYRELFYFLAWRDLLIRYKQTVVGVLWSVIRPVLAMLILTVVFGRIGQMPSAGVPYPLLVFCGMLPWQFFSTALSESGGSLVLNSNLISKVYFPRLVVPTSSVITSLADFCVSALILTGLMLWYGFAPPWTVLLLPVWIILAFAASLGAGVWLAALMVKYRDVRFIIPFIVQFGLYISPVGFVTSAVPAEYRTLYFLNPMAGIIDGVRWSVLGGQHGLDLPGVITSAASTITLALTGLWFFRKTEREFADII